jgi:hypothetical protein
MYKASQCRRISADPWIQPGVVCRGTKHQDAFLSAYKADRTALPFSALPVPLRHRQRAARLASAVDRPISLPNGKNMQARGTGKARGLRISTAWCGSRESVTVRGTDDRLALARPDPQLGEVWVNGLLLAPTIAPAARRHTPTCARTGRRAPTTGRGMPAV